MSMTRYPSDNRGDYPFLVLIKHNPTVKGTMTDTNIVITNFNQNRNSSVGLESLR
jgi:hypothetical protein